jgi:hypothetical protein
MAILTRDQIAKLAEIIRKHASWAAWRLLGRRYVTDQEVKQLEKEGLVPKGVETSSIKQAYVLGKLEATLKEAEWKNLNWDEVQALAVERQTPLQKMQIEAAEMSMDVTLRGLFSDVQKGLFTELSTASGAAATMAAVKETVAEEIKSGVEERKNYIQVGNNLMKNLGDTSRNWYRVACSEMHAAREQGVVGSILEGRDVYRRADGPDSDVAVVPDRDACEDCKRLYLEGGGKPKIFKLSELMNNAGSNYIRPWRKNAGPVVPPLHPHCFCRIRYVPPGWGWNKKGRFTVVDSDKYADHLQQKVGKSVEILSKAGDHSLLNDSLQHVPTREEINAISDRKEAMDLARRLGALLQLHEDDPNMYHQISQLKRAASARAVLLRGHEEQAMHEQETPDAE